MDLDNLRKEQDSLLQEKAELEAVINLPGWERINVALIAIIRANRQKEFDSKIGSLDDAFRSATDKGFMTGVETARNIPDALLTDLEFDLNSISTQIEEAQRDE